MPAVRPLIPVLCLAVAVSGGCREEGDVQVASLDFNGVEQVDANALEGVLQTREGSWIPEGRVSSFDVVLNDAQDRVSITVNVAEGEPIRIAGVELGGFDVLPESDR